MADVNIKYKGSNIATMDASGSKTMLTSGKYCEGDIVVEYTDPEKPTQVKSATPSLSAQSITPDSGKVLSQVDIGAITQQLLASLDSDFIAENIKKDVNLFGLVGSLESGLPSSLSVKTGEFTIIEQGTKIEGYRIQHNLGKEPLGFLLYKTDFNELNKYNAFQQFIYLKQSYKYNDVIRTNMMNCFYDKGASYNSLSAKSISIEIDSTNISFASGSNNFEQTNYRWIVWG